MLHQLDLSCIWPCWKCIVRWKIYRTLLSKFEKIVILPSVVKISFIISLFPFFFHRHSEAEFYFFILMKWYMKLLSYPTDDMNIDYELLKSLKSKFTTKYSDMHRHLLNVYVVWRSFAQFFLWIFFKYVWLVYHDGIFVSWQLLFSIK